MTRVLVLQQPSSTSPVDVWLREADPDVDVLIVSGADTRRSEQALAAGVRRILVDDYPGPAGTRTLLEACRRWRPDRIASNCEDDVLRAGHARTLFGVAGQSSASALRFRDKLAMKALFAEAGLAAPPARGVHCVEDVREAVTEWGPCVLKPRAAAAAEGVHVIEDVTAARDVLGADPFLVHDLAAGNMMVEQMVLGDVFHVDVVLRGRRAVLLSASRYVNPPHTFAEHDLVSVMLDPSDPDHHTVTDTAERFVAGLPVDHGAHVLHLELFRRPDGTCLMGEVASRVGGGLIKDGVRRTYGLDISRAAYLLAAGLPLPPLPSDPSDPDALRSDRLPADPEGLTGFVLWTAGPPPAVTGPRPDWVLFADVEDTAEGGTCAAGTGDGVTPPVVANSVTASGRALVIGGNSKELIDRIGRLRGASAR